MTVPGFVQRISDVKVRMLLTGQQILFNFNSTIIVPGLVPRISGVCVGNATN